MHLVEPIFLAGLAGAIVPLLIHLVGKKKPTVMKFPAFDFILRSKTRTDAGLRVRRILLLLLRMSAIAFLVLALSKPYLTGTTGPDVVGKIDSPASVLIALDTSFSMGLNRNGSAVFERARQVALETVAGLPEGCEAAYMEFSDSPRRVLGFEPIPCESIVKAIEAARLTARTTSVAKAVAKARQLLETARLPLRKAVVLTDLCSAGFAGVDPESLETVTVIDVSGQADRPNIALSGVTVEELPGEDYTVKQVQVRVKSFSRSRETSVPVRLFVEGAARAEGFVDLEPFGAADKAFRIEMRSGETQGAVAVDDPGLALDNARYFIVPESRPVQVLLLSGAPSTTPFSDETFFLERVLCPDTGPDPGMRCAVKDADALSAEDLAAYEGEVIFLCNTGPLPPAVIGALERFVSGGGGLFIAPGNRSDPDEMNFLLDGLLPGTLGVLRTSTDTPLRLARPALDDEVLLALAADDEELVKTASFRTVLSPSPGPGSIVRLAFEDGTSALLERHLRQGKVMYFSSTVDTDWNNLPARPVYLPLMRKIAMHLGRRLETRQADHALVGDTLTLPAMDGESIRVAAPDGTESSLTGEGASGAAYVPEQPGVYRISRGDAGLPGGGFAVNVDTRESDLTPLDEDRRPVRTGLEEKDAALSRTRKSPLWGWALAFLAGSMACEALLVGTFAPARRGALLCLLILAASTSLRAQGALPDHEPTLARLVYRGGNRSPRPNALRRLLWEVRRRTSVMPDLAVSQVQLDSEDLFQVPFLWMSGDGPFEPFTTEERKRLRRFIEYGGTLLVDDCSGRERSGFDQSVRRELQAVFPDRGLQRLPPDHAVFRSFYLLDAVPGRILTSPYLEGIDLDDRTAVIYCVNDLEGAFVRDGFGGWAYSTPPGGELQRERAFRLGINCILYGLTVNYKKDLVHQPFIRQRLN